MRSTYIEATRSLTIQTALPADTFVVAGMTGREAISDMYHFEVDLMSEQRKVVSFEKLLGQEATLSLKRGEGDERYFSGIVSSVGQGESVTIHQNGEAHEFIRFRVSIVPKLWMLSQTRRSRIFQRQSVPEILKTVLSGCNADIQLDSSGDTFLPREYCVQYREADLQFAKRLMEQEGIWFYFTHAASGHRMIVRSGHSSFPELPGTFLFDAQRSTKLSESCVHTWNKTQEIRPAKYTVRDFHFELPNQSLENTRNIQSLVQVGATTHSLTAGGNGLEVYDYPGGYSNRFDGVSKDGGDQASQLQNIYNDGRKCAATGIQAQAASALQIGGESSAIVFTAGCKFKFERHWSDDGLFLLTSVAHTCYQPIGTNSEGEPFEYRNEFTCLPAALPFRAALLTPAPVVHGTQSATVVGPSGEEIFTDKYGRVKVQFRWDREGTSDSNSSCWVRVTSAWAGKNWGAIHIPRVGQEVIVAFEEGDPNRPIVVGSVYNANNMPPYDLPDNKTQSGCKSRSTPEASGSNEFRFEDKHLSEEIFLHAQKDLVSSIEHDETRTVKNDRTTTITGNESKTVQQGDQKTTLATGNQTITLDQGNQTITISEGNQKITLSMGNQTTSISLGKSETEAMQSIELKVGQSSVKLDQSGVTIKGLVVKIEAEIEAELKGTITQVKGDALLMAKGGLVMIN